MRFPGFVIAIAAKRDRSRPIQAVGAVRSSLAAARVSGRAQWTLFRSTPRTIQRLTAAMLCTYVVLMASVVLVGGTNDITLASVPTAIVIMAAIWFEERWINLGNLGIQSLFAYGTAAGAGAILFGPGFAFLVPVTALMVVQIISRRRVEVWHHAFNAGQYALSGLVYIGLLSAFRPSVDDPLAVVAAVWSANVVGSVLSNGLVIWIRSLHSGEPIDGLGVAREMLTSFVGADGFTAVTVAAIVAAATAFGVVGGLGIVAVFLAPVVLYLSPMAGRVSAEMSRALVTAAEANRRRAALVSAIAGRLRAAAYDTATGLLRGQAQLELAVSHLTADDRAVLVVMGDVAGLKSINDRRGHEAGDALLRAVAAGLLSTIRAGDRAIRVGGDEFAVVISCPSSAAATSRIISQISTHVERNISREPLLAGAVTWLRLGAAHSSDGLSDLVARADAALTDVAARDRAAGNIGRG